MRAKTRAKHIVRALEAALPHLWDGKELQPHPKYKMICVAVSGCADSRDEEHARKEIMTRLGGFSNLEGWLMRAARVSEEHLTHPNIQAHRIAWVKLLIAEFKEKAK